MNQNLNTASFYPVAEISLDKALKLNEKLIDDKKVAFQLPDGAGGLKYVVKLQFALDFLSPAEYFKTELSQAQVDGTTPVTKLRRLYP